MPSDKILKLIGMTAEITGKELSAAAVDAIGYQLDSYPEDAVAKALIMCQRELSRSLTLADVISRIDDGRPSADVAYASLPWDENDSVCWTDEARLAFGVALPVYDSGDKYAARAAFVSEYKRLCQENRDAGKPVEWSTSLGYSKSGRENAIREFEQKTAKINPAHHGILEADPVPERGAIEAPEETAKIFSSFTGKTLPTKPKKILDKFSKVA